MPNLIYPYLVGLVSTVVIPVVAMIAYVYAHLRGVEFERLRRRLPLATRFEDLQMRVADLQQLHDTLTVELAESHRVIDEADRERQWLDKHREEVLQMRVEAEQLERHRQEYERVTAELADQREKLERATHDLKSADWELEQRQTRISEADRHLGELGERIKATETELHKAKQQLEALHLALQDARAAEAEARKQAAVLQEREATLRPAIDELTKKRDELSSLLKEMERQAKDIQARRSRSEAELAGVETSIESMKGHLEALRTEARKRDRTLATAGEALSELWTAAVSDSEFPDGPMPKKTKEEECLAAAERYLRELGLVFPSRTVRAFHTALKTAEQTPLLVLAGISGTGKSLLPRRYAEAMGMHCLPVPVQPRWDGPQDLIGFYNYLESRYKATELVRALIQFDEHASDWVPKEYESELSDRLLIVLLDEMNLARIEYYFSEFLSRLETRRDIDPKDPEDRAKASLLLDLGNMETDSQPRVFVDRNVMFVGTMNEDESTMTLSDKVVDRAAVMRFGRPRSLETLKPGQGVERTKSYLQRSTWSDWINAGRRRELRAERATVQRLNDALAGIGKPFGFRTSEAILEYVRQYPDQTDHGRQHALADQIEQRIMPRLRGQDTSDDRATDAIRAVLEVAGTLDDVALTKAIEQALGSQTGHLFQWSGVARDVED